MKLCTLLGPLSLCSDATWAPIQYKDAILYQYRKSHCGDKTIVRSSYLHNGISYTGKMVSSLYWINPLLSGFSPQMSIWWESQCFHTVPCTLVGIGSGNGAGRRQAITRHNADVLSIRSFATNISETLIKIFSFFFLHKRHWFCATRKCVVQISTYIVVVYIVAHIRFMI